MLSWTWCIPALPLAGFLVLAIFGGRFPRGATAAVGAGSVGLSFAAAAAAGAMFMVSPPAGGSFTFALWQWIRAGWFSPGLSFTLDALSVVMILVVTGVGFLIHLYSTRFMADEEGYSRFFAYMNLFVGSMLILVMASNLLLLYLGWEGVGLCSFLLIGFWYKDPGERALRAKGLHRHAHRRRVPCHRAVPRRHEPRHARHQGNRPESDDRSGRPAPRWQSRLPPCSWAARWASPRSFPCRRGFPTPWRDPRP